MIVIALLEYDSDGQYKTEYRGMQADGTVCMHFFVTISNCSVKN